MTCTDPRFRWLGVWWSPCLTCGALAWTHPQADPLADIRNTIERALSGESAEKHPPVMRPVPDNAGRGLGEIQ